MQIIKEEKVKYKRGFRRQLEDGTVIYIIRNQGRFRVEGTYGKNFPGKELEMFWSPWYASLKGVKNYLLKNFNLELEE